MAFDSYLKDIRIEKNINQTQMAEILDISRTAIKLIENGSTKYPSKKVLHNLAIYLNQSELDVMAKILFTDKSLDDKSSDEYFVCSYLTHMYLEGWNINDHPYVYPIWQGKSIEFDGRITKKRQPNNIMIVTTFKRELFRIKEIKNEDDALTYIGDLMSKLMTILDKYKGVVLLFNAENTIESNTFSLFSSMNTSMRRFNMNLVLFSSESGIVDKKKL